MSKESLQKAVELAGGQTALADGIRARIPGSKIGQVHVWGWLNSVKIEVPPPEVVLPIADFLEYRMTPHQLRADLYPNPADALPVGLVAPVDSFGELGESRGSDRRLIERRDLEADFGEFGEPRDGDRRIDDRRPGDGVDA